MFGAGGSRRALVAIVLAAVFTCAASAQAAPPPSTVNNLTVTAFNPYLNPADERFDSQGFDFVNLFKNSKFTKSVLGHKFVFAGSYGLCGGMAYAALDTLESSNGTTTPQGVGPPTKGLTSPPDSGPVFKYLYGRLVDSLTGGNTLFTMAKFMLFYSQHHRDVETFHAFTHEIVPAINAGNPIPLLLVESLKVDEVSENHQVLATGYFRRGNANGQAVVQVYDPNFPGRFMYLNTHENNGWPSQIETYDEAGTEPSGTHFYGFFATDYTYHRPYWALAKPTGNLLQTHGADWTEAEPGETHALTAGLGAANDTTSVVPPDWTPTGNFTAVQYTMPGTSAPNGPVVPGKGIPVIAPLLGFQFPTAMFSAGINGGINFFAGGPGNATSSAHQRIVLPFDGSLIDAGGQVATMSADLGGSLTSAASMVVTASFVSGNNHVLGSFSIGPVSAAERNDQTELLARSATAPVPKGTATINVSMSATGGTTVYDDAYADNLSLTIGPRSRKPIGRGPGGK